MDQTTATLACVLRHTSALFVYLPSQDYLALTRPTAWAPLEQTLQKCLNDASPAACPQAKINLGNPPSSSTHTALQNTLFVGGMPLATLPIESLYRTWSNNSGGDLAATRGLYCSDAAQHLQSIFQRLDIELPASFQAMPDHLVLICELVALLWESGNKPAAAQVSADHLSWLPAYYEALCARTEHIDNVVLYTSEARQDIKGGIAFLMSLVVSIIAITERMKAEEEMYD